MRVIALVDGEHYPPVTRWGIERARADGYEVAAALLMGGSEKLGADARLDLGQVSVERVGDDPRGSLATAIGLHGAEGVLDLSDEPVLDYRTRMEMVAVALAAGVPYLGPDFRFDPPVGGPPLAVPTVAVIGSGKRVAKTAVGGHVARIAAKAGRNPVLVAMGRGGPPEPVIAGPGDVTVEALLARADRREHAASDFLEDALTAGVATIGARRVGGGLSGRPFATNVRDAANLAVESGAGMVILEGSGASVPPVPWDAGVLVVPADLDPEFLGGYLGPYRVLRSDLAIFIIGSGSISRPENLSTLVSQVRRLRADVRVAMAELHPTPLADVRGRDVFFTTTAPSEVAERLAERLERTSECRVVKVSSNLADRAALMRDFEAVPRFDVLLTELKAAAIDVAARTARRRGADVVFVDNRPRGVGGDGPLDELVEETLGRAVSRASDRTREGR